MKSKTKKIIIGCTMFVLVLLLGGAFWLMNRDKGAQVQQLVGDRAVAEIV